MIRNDVLNEKEAKIKEKNRYILSNVINNDILK